jgi:hypothetical protein
MKTPLFETLLFFCPSLESGELCGTFRVPNGADGIIIPPGLGDTTPG